MSTEILTVQETAELLKRHSSTIYRRLEGGEWPFAWKDGNDWRIEKDALMNHLRTQPVHTRKPASDPMPPSRVRFREMLDDERRKVA